MEYARNDRVPLEMRLEAGENNASAVEVVEEDVFLRSLESASRGESGQHQYVYSSFY